MHKGALKCQLTGLLQAGRQHLQVNLLICGYIIKISVTMLLQRQLTANAIQCGMDDHGIGQIGIAHGVGRTQLCTAMLRLGGRHPQKLGTVLLRPGYKMRCLVIAQPQV